MPSTEKHVMGIEKRSATITNANHVTSLNITIKTQEEIKSSISNVTTIPPTDGFISISPFYLILNIHSLPKGRNGFMEAACCATPLAGAKGGLAVPHTDKPPMQKKFSQNSRLRAWLQLAPFGGGVRPPWRECSDHRDYAESSAVLLVRLPPLQVACVPRPLVRA